MDEELTPIIEWLTYKFYENQRELRPDIPYWKWRQIFRDAVIFEEIYENFKQSKEK